MKEETNNDFLINMIDKIEDWKNDSTGDYIVEKKDYCVKVYKGNKKISRKELCFLIYGYGLEQCNYFFACPCNILIFSKI